MELFVLILNRVELLDDILSYFVECGVGGATVVDSVGMGRIIATMPIFAGFRDLMGSSRPSNKVILAVVDEAVIPELEEGLGKIMGDLYQPGVGLWFTLPVNRVAGLGKGF